MALNRAKRIARAGLIAGLIASVASPAAASPAAAPGDLDRRFGDHGRVTVQTSDEADASDLAIQRDGRIVGVGSIFDGNDYDGVVFRRLPNGKPDRRFGVHRLDLGGDERARAVVIQPNGKIVIVGETSINNDAVVWRFNSDGTVDRTFGELGVRLIDSAGIEVGYDVALANDGKIVVAGSTSVGNGVMAVYRLTRLGAFDRSFDGDGAFGFGGGPGARAFAVAVQNDDKVVVTGDDGTGQDLAVYRLTAAGEPDQHYGVAGKATIAIEAGRGYGIALERDGDAVVTAESYNGDDADAAIVRVKRTGQVDRTFGGTTGVRIDLGGYEYVFPVSVFADGSIVASGETSVGSDAIVVRLRANGNRDARFGSNGVRRIGGGLASAWCMAVQRDGKLLIGGTDGKSFYRPAIYRLIG